MYVYIIYINIYIYNNPKKAQQNQKRKKFIADSIFSIYLLYIYIIIYMYIYIYMIIYVYIYIYTYIHYIVYYII